MIIVYVRTYYRHIGAQLSHMTLHTPFSVLIFFVLISSIFLINSRVRLM